MDKETVVGPRLRKSFAVGGTSKENHKILSANSLKAKVLSDCNFLGKMQSFDAFGENFNMKLDKENSVLNSTVGSVFTIIAYLAVFMYTYLKIDVWIQKKDIDIMATKLIDHMAYDYIFSHDLGFNLAIAFTDFDNNLEPILDKSYGQLVFNAYEWGNDDHGKYFSR